MADDLTDAGTEVQAIQGIENHPMGFIVLRLFRLLQAARQHFGTVDQRLTDLEARVTKLGG